MVKMKIYRYVTGVLLLVVMALLFQNMQMHKVLKISGEIADGNAKQNYDRLEYILEHFDNNVVDSTKTFIRCAESIRRSRSISEKQRDTLLGYASAVVMTDAERNALLWSAGKSGSLSGRLLPLSLLEDYVTGFELDHFFSNAFVNYGFVYVIAPKDTVRLGELYEADLKFVLKDNAYHYTYMVSTEDMIDAIKKGCFDTLKDGHFQTIAQEKGKHTLNGLYKIERFKNEAYFPFQINYYVK